MHHCLYFDAAWEDFLTWYEKNSQENTESFWHKSDDVILTTDRVSRDRPTPNRKHLFLSRLSLSTRYRTYFCLLENVERSCSSFFILFMAHWSRVKNRRSFLQETLNWSFKHPSSALCSQTGRSEMPLELISTCESEFILGMSSVGWLGSGSGSMMCGHMMSHWPIIWRQEVFQGKQYLKDVCWGLKCFAGFPLFISRWFNRYIISIRQRSLQISCYKLAWVHCWVNCSLNLMEEYEHIATTLETNSLNTANTSNKCTFSTLHTFINQEAQTDV